MDAHAVLGVPPGASSGEVAAAYRRLAKRWHPDHAGERSAGRMAEINRAYAALRDGSASAQAGERARGAPAPPRPRVAGEWLPAATRRALGPELTRVLFDGEPVALVARAATWASPRTVLAVTDRRLLWLHDDAVMDRVRALRFEQVAEVEPVRLAWPRRRHAVLRLKLRGGRRLSFAELEPASAEAIAGRIRASLTRDHRP